MALLEVTDLTVGFGAVEVVHGVSFGLEPGRITGLIGPNGAGKTTVIDALGGLVAASGHVSMAGTSLDGLAPHERARLGVSRTFQTMELFEDLTVAENLAVAADSSRRGAVETTLSLYGLTDVGHLLPSSLSHARRRLLALARALVSRPRVLLLDEPAAGLDGPERHTLGLRLRLLAAGGLAILLVDHDMGLVLRVCDEVVVLDNGSVIASGAPQTVRADPRVAAAYLGTTPQRANTAARRVVARTERKPLLEVSGLSAGYRGIAMVDGVDLTVARGEVVALLGLNGAGRTTTLSAISGALVRMAGEVHLDGEVLPAAAHRVTRRGLVHIPQGRSLFNELTVHENLRLARAEMALRDEAFPALAGLARRKAGGLSGGEARMVALARALSSEAKVLLVDEASLGLSPLATQAVLARLRAAADDRGLAIVVVDQHVELALAISDRAYVMAQGRVVATGDADRIDVGALLPGTG